MGIRVQAEPLEDHPAVRQWEILRPDLPARAIDCWGKGGIEKPAVFRITLGDPQLPAVYAKRAPAGGRLAIEREIHERVLPQLPVPAARFLGFRTDDSLDWLFVEDVGDRRLVPDCHAETEISGDWLGRVHAAAATLAEKPNLPDGGAARYLEHLRLARRRILDAQVNPGLSADDLGLLTQVLRLLDRIEASWSALERAAEGIPPTLIHGDYQTKNLRLREGANGLELIPIDWETAGWGLPLVDLADAPHPRVRNQVDLGAYHATVQARWPHLTRAHLERLRSCGYLWRRMAAVQWETAYLKFDHPRWLLKPLMTLNLYLLQLEEGLGQLAPWL